MARKFQRILGGYEAPFFKTESGFIPNGASLVEAGLAVMYKSGSPVADIDEAQPIVLSDGTSAIGLLNQDVTPSRAASTLGYVVGSKTEGNFRRRLTHEAEEGDVCAVTIGPAHCIIPDECYVGTPAPSNPLYVTKAGKLTAAYNATPSATEGGLMAAVCESAPTADGNIRILLLGPYATYYSYVS